MVDITAIQIDGIKLKKETMVALLHAIKPSRLNRESTYFDVGVEYNKERIREVISKDLGLTVDHPINTVIRELSRG